MLTSVTSNDKKLLRDLAKEVKDISEDPVWTEKRVLWKAKNALGRVRPLVLTSLPDAAWRELLPESELTPLSLAAALRRMLEAGRPQLMRMAQAARATAITDADQRLADACVAAAGGAA